MWVARFSAHSAISFCPVWVIVHGELHLNTQHYRECVAKCSNAIAFAAVPRCAMWYTSNDTAMDREDWKCHGKNKYNAENRMEAERKLGQGTNGEKVKQNFN